MADKISLRVPDIDTFVDNLNTAGYLLKKGPKTYQVLRNETAKIKDKKKTDYEPLSCLC